MRASQLVYTLGPGKVTLRRGNRRHEWILGRRDRAIHEMAAHWYSTAAFDLRPSVSGPSFGLHVTSRDRRGRREVTEDAFQRLEDRGGRGDTGRDAGLLRRRPRAHGDAKPMPTAPDVLAVRAEEGHRRRR